MQVLTTKPLCFLVKSDLFLPESRIDVHFFHPDYLSTEEVLRQCDIKTLEQISKRIKKGIFYILASEYVSEGIPFVRVSNLKDGTIVDENITYISNSKNEREKKTEFHPGDILVSKTGNLAISIIPDHIPKCNISQDIIGIEISNNYNSEYVAIFLSSKFGTTQLKRIMQGQVQPHITVTDIKKIKIVFPSEETQKKIVKIMKNAIKRRKENLEKIKNLHNELNDYFLKELGLMSPSALKENVFLANLEDRMDPYYYHPKFTEILELLRKGKFELKRLMDIAEFSREQIDPKKEPDRLFKYIQIQNIDEKNHKISSYTPILGKEAPGRAKMLIREGDILLPILGGSLKSVAIVPKEYNGEVATNGFAVLRVKDNNLRYLLFYYLMTDFAQLQIERNLTGAIMPSISKSELKNILIPLPDKITQEKIAKKIKEIDGRIIKLKVEAEEVIEIAKKKVEAMIIGGNCDRNI